MRGSTPLSGTTTTEGNTMVEVSMATVAIDAYETAYPRGYDPNGVTLLDYIEPRQPALGVILVDCTDHGCLCEDVVFADGSRIVNV